MNKRRFLIGAIAASVAISIFCAAGCSGCSKKQEWVEEVPDTFINQTLDFELTPDVEMPTPDVSSHRGEEIEELVVKYGQSYENDEYLKDDVVLFRRWQWEALYNSLAQKAKDNPRYLNTYRLQAEAYLIKSEYQAALSALDKVLSYNHDDVYALGLSAYVQNIQGNTAQRDARLKALKKVSPKCHDDLYELMAKVTGWLAEEHGTDKLDSNEQRNYDAIGILGVSPTADGKLQGSGAARVKSAFKAAYLSRDSKNNSPKIIPSGGAIDTEYSEAKVMGDYIVRNSASIAESLEIDPAEFCVYGDDIILDEQARDTIGNIIGICSIMAENDLHNLLIIASEDQVMRAECIAKAYIDAHDLDITLASHAAGGTSPSANQSKYSYICAASAYGLFTKNDYAEHSKYVVDTTNELTKFEGKVVVDKATADKGETITYSAVPAAGYEVDKVEVKTASGTAVTANNGTFTMPDESVMISATFKRIAGTVTLDFFNSENFGTNKNGITSVPDALKACENDIKAVNSGLVSVTDTIADDPLISANNALGYGKMGGFGLAAGGRIGGFKLNFKDDYKISKIQVTAVRFAENEGHLQVNGIDPTKGELQGEANVFDPSYYVEYTFDAPVNSLDFRTVADTVTVDGASTTNYGRVIIYSVTLFLEDATKVDTLYSVNVGEIEHGSVTPSIDKAIAGTTVSLDVVGDKGYFVDTLKVMNGETEVEVTDNSFVMPNGNVTISATFVSRLTAATTIEVTGDKEYNWQIAGAIVLDKSAYSVGEKATITVKSGAGFELDSLVVKTESGKNVTVNNDNTFTFTDENVEITATYKVKAGTTTLDFLKPEYVGTAEHGSYTTADIQSGYQERINGMYGENYVTVSNVDACGIDKFGGWGIGSGSKPGSFTLDFGDKKISKIVVNGAKNKDGEGLFKVSGVEGDTTFTAVNGGEGGEFDIDSNITYEFTDPVSALEFLGNAKAVGRSIIYSITIIWAE